MKRNLVRILGTPLLLGVFLTIFHFGGYKGLVVIVGLLCMGALLEFYLLCRKKGHNPELFAIFLLAVAFLLILFEEGPWILILMVGLLVCLRMIAEKDFSLIDAALTVWGFLYVGSLLIGLVVLQNYNQDWKIFVIYLLATNKGSDIAAFCIGKLFGRTKLAPSISPGKTIIGAVGGFCGGFGSGLWALSYTKFYISADRLYILLLTAGVVIAGQIGDLVESAIKRWAGVKDSSNLLPEFGGVMDMMDSFFLSVPIFALFGGWY